VGRALSRFRDGRRGSPGLLPQPDDAFVVGDDRRFPTMLSMRGIAFPTPADMLVVLAQQGVLTEAEAGAAPERLRPATRTKAYRLPRCLVSRG